MTEGQHPIQSYFGDVNQFFHPHGKGRMFSKQENLIYEGEFHDGKKQGTGRIFYASTGNAYIGTWEQD